MIASTLNAQPLVADYLDLIDIALSKVVRRIPAHIDRDDLRSSGLLALMSLCNKCGGFPSRAEVFVRVYGAILDELRLNDSLSRGERRDAKNVQGACSSLRAELGRDPLIPEIAARTGLPCARVDVILEKLAEQAEVSLDTLSDDSPHPCDVESERDASEMLSRVLGRLPEKQAMALRLFYLDGETLERIATKLSVSTERARQLRVAGEKRLKSDADALDLWKKLL